MPKCKICVLTGRRAEYGLLRWVMQGIRRHPGLRVRDPIPGAILLNFGLGAAAVHVLSK